MIMKETYLGVREAPRNKRPLQIKYVFTKVNITRNHSKYFDGLKNAKMKIKETVPAYKNNSEQCKLEEEIAKFYSRFHQKLLYK